MAEQLQFHLTDEPDERPAASLGTELPRDPAEKGYREFRSEREHAIQALEKKFGLVLHKQVRLTLFGFPGEFTGKLVSII